MSPVHGFILLLILPLIQSASCCNPVNEFESRIVTTTNISHLIGYQLPPCPALYRLASIVSAELSNPATPQSNPLNITNLLTTRCLSQNVAPCTVDIPLNGLDVPGEHTILNVKVNYTCQMEDPGSIQSLMSTWEKEVYETTWVKYIRVKLSSARMNWNCVISSSTGSAVSWSWMLKECTVGAFGCMSWNRTLVEMPRRPETSPFCMEAQSLGTIWVIARKFCPRLTETIAIDIQVTPASDFNIVCKEEPPSNNAADIGNLNDPQLEPLKDKCSQLTWIDPLPSTPDDHSTSTSRTTPAGNPETSETTMARNSEISVGAASTAEQFYTTKRVSSLGLGLGIGIGLLVVISAVALAIVCIRRKKRGFDAKSSTLSNHNTNVGGATAEKDGGFVLANDVFAIKNIYDEISQVNPNQNPNKQIQGVQVRSSCTSDINRRNCVEGYNNSQDVPTDETAENRYDQEPTPPAATSAPPGEKNPKRASSLSRKLFKQIAALAKQEERQSRISKGGEARGVPESAVEIGGSETSIVDRWLYSSSVGINSAVNTLSGSNNDNDAVCINRRFEIDV